MAFPSLARNFEYTYEGKTITYTVIDEIAKTCMTKPGMYESYAGNLVEGDVKLPEHPMRGDDEFTLISIGEESFFRNEGITSIDIPSTVTSIKDRAFYRCSNISSIEIPNSVISIGDNAFYTWNTLTYVKIPESVRYIGQSAFSTKDLTKVEFASIESLCKIEFKTDSANPLWGAHLYIDGEEVTELKIPNTVTSIGKYAFYGCEGLTSIELPESLISIGEEAFGKCDNIYYIISRAEKAPFFSKECFSLNYRRPTLIIPDGSIISYCTQGWTDFFHIMYESDIESDNEPESYILDKTFEFYYNTDTKEACLSRFINKSEVKEVIIPQSITINNDTYNVVAIGYNAFYECSNLTSVNISVP